MPIMTDKEYLRSCGWPQVGPLCYMVPAGRVAELPVTIRNRATYCHTKSMDCKIKIFGNRAKLAKAKYADSSVEPLVDMPTWEMMHFVNGEDVS